jgi:hypothetical protein
MPQPRSWLVLAACLTLLFSPPLATAGDGKVTGTITVNGKPLAAGKVIFHLDDGEFVGAKVKDGAYKIGRVPEGTRKITIEGKGVPAKYASEDTSGLTSEVMVGDQTFDISLK